MSTENLHQPNPDLPEEIIVNILCRLPVKSLIRFSCVSKRWHYRVFSDQQFAQSHFKLASEQRTLTQRLLIPTADLRLYSLDPETPSFGDEGNSSLSLINLTFPKILLKSWQSQYPCRLLGSCNGIVVVVDVKDGGHLYLWNPSTGSTGSVRSVPMGGALNKPKTGFGYVSATDDDKILLAGMSAHIDMFSSRANAWKRIEQPPRLGLWLAGCERSVGVLTNEALHWAFSNEDYDIDDPAIIVFDLAKEEFRLLPLPVDYKRPDHFKYLGVQVISGGCLCVSFCKTPCDVECTEFWVMREYGVRESWTMLYKLYTAYLPEWFNWDLLYGVESPLDPIIITEKDIVVLQLSDSKYKLIMIQCHKEGQKLVCSKPYFFNEGMGSLFKLLQYDETLLRLPNHDDANLV